MRKHHEEVEGVHPDGTYLLYHDMFNRGPNDSCLDLIKEKQRVTKIHYHYSACKAFDRQFGNRLAILYGVKMIAYALGVPFQFTCGMFEGEDANGAAYLVPMMNTDGVGVLADEEDGQLSAEDLCNRCGGLFCSWYNPDLAFAARFMESDWSYLTRPHLNLVPVADHDDAVIHLRLGDGLFSTNGANEGQFPTCSMFCLCLDRFLINFTLIYGHAEKGIFPHATYTNLLKQVEQEMGPINSIGIITAPFTGKGVRSWDMDYISMSEVIAFDLISVLQTVFPQAAIRIHNNPDSTIMESLARLVHSRKVAICGCSTFCPYPLMATRGIGYVYNPLGPQNRWVKKAAEMNPNFRLFDTPMLNGMMISNEKTGWKLSETDVMRWLRNQDVAAGNIDIVEEPLFRQAAGAIGF